MRGFNEMRMCVFVLNCIMFIFFLFGVNIELCWYDSAQPSG